MVPITHKITTFDKARVTIQKLGLVQSGLSHKSFTGMTKRRWNAMLKIAWKTVGWHWHKHMLPKHFTEAGAREYDYAKRTDGYMSDKMSKWGHQNPLSWSGDMEAEARSVSKTNVKSTFKGAGVVITAPRYLNQVYGNGPNKALELSRVTQAETDELAKLLDKELTRMATTSSPLKLMRGHRK